MISILTKNFKSSKKVKANVTINLGSDIRDNFLEL